MIKVKIELRSARTGKVESLGEIRITNDATGTPLRGNYDVLKCGKNGRVLKVARVENHPRKSNTIFNLLRKALEALKA